LRDVVILTNEEFFSWMFPDGKVSYDLLCQFLLDMVESHTIRMLHPRYILQSFHVSIAKFLGHQEYHKFASYLIDISSNSGQEVTNHKFRSLFYLSPDKEGTYTNLDISDFIDTIWNRALRTDCLYGVKNEMVAGFLDVCDCKYTFYPPTDKTKCTLGIIVSNQHIGGILFAIFMFFLVKEYRKGSIGMIELAGSYNNTAGFCLYSKYGFVPFVPSTREVSERFYQPTSGHIVSELLLDSYVSCQNLLFHTPPEIRNDHIDGEQRVLEICQGQRKCWNRFRPENSFLPFCVLASSVLLPFDANPVHAVAEGPRSRRRPSSEMSNQRVANAHYFTDAQLFFFWWVVCLIMRDTCCKRRLNVQQFCAYLERFTLYELEILRELQRVSKGPFTTKDVNLVSCQNQLTTILEWCEQEAVNRRYTEPVPILNRPIREIVSSLLALDFIIADVICVKGKSNQADKLRFFRQEQKDLAKRNGASFDRRNGAPFHRAFSRKKVRGGLLSRKKKGTTTR
jgi:hypothetical protein